jgi:hypothetical protein
MTELILFILPSVILTITWLYNKKLSDTKRLPSIVWVTLLVMLLLIGANADCTEMTTFGCSMVYVSTVLFNGPLLILTSGKKVSLVLISMLALGLGFVSFWMNAILLMILGQAWI